MAGIVLSLLRGSVFYLVENLGHCVWALCGYRCPQHRRSALTEVIAMVIVIVTALSYPIRINIR